MLESGDIILKRRDDGQLQHMYETNRSYDTFGEDKQHINTINLTTGLNISNLFFFILQLTTNSYFRTRNV